MKLYGLIGRKLGHSFSARFFNEKFQREGMDALYELFELPTVNMVESLIHEHPLLVGFNVTIPYKQEILPYLSGLTTEAKEIGAVNTVKVIRLLQPENQFIQNRLQIIGHNTDAIGFWNALSPFIDQITAGSNDGFTQLKALVLGIGGASKAVVYMLRKHGIEVTQVSRRDQTGAIKYEQLTPSLIQDHKIIINCTPLGMWPDIDSCPNIPYHSLTADHLCFDLVYNPEVTEFMRRAAEHGAVVSNGLKMLYGQAVAAWDFWQKPVIRKFMSRDIEIHYADNRVERYPLSIAEISYLPDGTISNVKIEKFKEEIPEVEYLDHPLVIHISHQ